MTAQDGVAYDQIGHDYSTRRVPDPRIASAIMRALSDARTPINVGAGAGSYEPDDRPVLAIEPSAVIATQPGAHAAGGARLRGGSADRRRQR
jgi:hypothetical protein